MKIPSNKRVEEIMDFKRFAQSRKGLIFCDKKKVIEYLKKRKINTSIPSVVKFRTRTGDLKRFDARRCGVYIVKWGDVLKALRLK